MKIKNVDPFNQLHQLLSREAKCWDPRPTARLLIAAGIHPKVMIRKTGRKHKYPTLSLLRYNDYGVETFFFRNDQMSRNLAKLGRILQKGLKPQQFRSFSKFLIDRLMKLLNFFRVCFSFPRRKSYVKLGFRLTRRMMNSRK